jgi:hypothetical protein
VKVKVDSQVEVKVGDKTVKAHASPTTDLRLDIVRSLGGDTALPETLATITLVDDTGIERDSASIDSTKWSFTYDTLEYTWHQAQQRVAVPITVSYNLARIRLKGATKLYFEYTLSTPISVAPGQGAVVTITIKVTVSFAHSGSGTNVIGSYYPRTAGTIVKRFTSGEEKGAKPYYIWIYHPDGSVVRAGTMTVSVDETNLRVTGTLTYTPSADEQINRYDYDIETGAYLYVFMDTITLTGGLGHQWTLTIQL